MAAESWTESTEPSASVQDSGQANLAAFDTREVRSGRWIDGLNPNYYTLQLVSVGTEESVHDFLDTINVTGQEKGYVSYEAAGSIRYGAFLGIYESYTDAERARTELPEHLQANKPWIRRIGDLQQIAR